ncbi:hypothetical protein GIB67_025137 [Kingdonia uniflora]|uniref:t-SNARE coiled-coil homology domain-containing protein n=1 Tax=Kingdonia uniflora TaxID=39325 RepID=A0A7J7N854_9MAGN|nr:hypothetical protein GIB67_025137 [Kingdonia uniflora]
MNDLISSSFKRYTGLKQQAYMNDREAGTDTDLDKFFSDVKNVKDDMKFVKNLYRNLKNFNELSKSAQNAKTVKVLRTRMDAEMTQVLKRVKVIKGKLEAFERSNVAHRKLPGCGPGSSADRTRTLVVRALGKKLKDIMNDFQQLRGNMNAEYKETVKRRYFTITGQKANEETIENLISSGESENFLQKAIQEHGRGQILDTISEIQERHDAVKEIEKNLLELQQVFSDMAALVEAQGQQLNDFESQVAHASSFVTYGMDQLQGAKETQKNSRKWTCMAIILGLGLVIFLVLPIVLRSIEHLRFWNSFQRFPAQSGTTNDVTKGMLQNNFGNHGHSWQGS